MWPLRSLICGPRSASYPKHVNGIIAQVFTEEFRPVPEEGLSWRDDLLTPFVFHPDASAPWNENWTYIGRECSTTNLLRSMWANPFRVTAHIGRQEAIKLFEDCLLKSPTLLRDLPLLLGRLLVCHCRSEEACHRDAIVPVLQLSRDQQGPSFQISSLEGFRAVQLLDLTMGVLAAVGIKPELGHVAAEGSVQLGISIGEDRKLVVLDGRAPQLLKALNGTLRLLLRTSSVGCTGLPCKSIGVLLQIGLPWAVLSPVRKGSTRGPSPEDFPLPGPPVSWTPGSLDLGIALLASHL